MVMEDIMNYLLKCDVAMHMQMTYLPTFIIVIFLLIPPVHASSDTSSTLIFPNFTESPCRLGQYLPHLIYFKQPNRI